MKLYPKLKHLARRFHKKHDSKAREHMKQILSLVFALVYWIIKLAKRPQIHKKFGKYQARNNAQVFWINPLPSLPGCPTFLTMNISFRELLWNGCYSQLPGSAFPKTPPNLLSGRYRGRKSVNFSFSLIHIQNLLPWENKIYIKQKATFFFHKEDPKAI